MVRDWEAEHSNEKEKEGEKRSGRKEIKQDSMRSRRGEPGVLSCSGLQRMPSPWGGCSMLCSES